MPGPHNSPHFSNASPLVLHPSAYVAGPPYQLCRRCRNMVRSTTTNSTSSLHIADDQYSRLLRTVSDNIPTVLVFSSHRTVVGTQQRTAGPNAFDRRHPHPVPPSHGSTAQQIYAAPVNSHPETPRRPGSASDCGPLSMAKSSFRPLLDRSSACLSCRRHARVLNEKQ